MSSSASSNLTRAALLAGLLLAAAGCEPPEYVYGFNVTGQTFTLYSDDVGIHPHDDVLLDPNNPFAEYGVSLESKFAILESGGNVAAFYAWSTLLATQPSGEHQFFTGTTLQGIYEIGEAPEEDLPTVRRMAIRAYQAVLDHFPDSVTFDASGERSSRLATFAFNRILDMGGRVQGDWVLVETPAGGTEAVRSSSDDPPRPDEEEE